MKLKVFFATVFVFLFAEEVYSLGLSYEGVKSNECNYDGRYMRINIKECENINSRNKCQAMADGETSSDSNTDFTLEKPKNNKLSKLRCISFNNIYSLMVQGNNVSFVNVSCEKGGKDVWFKFKELKDHDHPGEKNKYHGFFIRRSMHTMCLTRSCNGNLYVVKVNSPDDRKCFFKQKIKG